MAYVNRHGVKTSGQTVGVRMFIWKKPKKVVLQCFTTRPGLPEMFAPVRMARATPDWWKKTTSIVDPELAAKGSRKFGGPTKLQKTVKHCYAVQKTFENAIAYPLWSEAFVAVNASGDPKGVVPANEHPGEHHPVHQYPGMMSNNWVNFKFKSPWLFYTDRPVHFYMANPFYHIHDHNWQTMPGVVEFYYQHHTNVNMVFRRPSGSAGFEYEFRAGDIMAYFVPMFEEDIEIQAETVDQKDWDRLEFGSKIWFNAATGHRKNDIGGCPLHRS